MYRLLVIGFSAGGIPLVTQILESMPADYPLPIAIVGHWPSGHESHLAELLGASCQLPVSAAKDKEAIVAGRVYLAPADYHLLIDRTMPSAANFALSVDAPVKSVRPSIDVLFESAAQVFESSLIAVLLCGANSDGADGMVAVKQLGGLTIVLDPQECEFSTMPRSAIAGTTVDYVSSMDEIVSLLRSVHEKP